MLNSSEEPISPLPPPWTHFPVLPFQYEMSKTAIFPLLSATTVTYSGYRWLLTPKEVINKPPEWLLETRTPEKFLRNQKTSERLWPRAGMHQSFRGSSVLTGLSTAPWLWEYPLLPHIPQNWPQKRNVRWTDSATMFILLVFIWPLVCESDSEPWSTSKRRQLP